MIDFKLAKQLRDAGFSQDGEGKYIYKDIGSICRKESEIERRNSDKSCCDDYDCSWQSEEFYVPTLSELIEACGHSFVDLQLTSGVQSMRNKNTLYWVARGFIKGKIYSTEEAFHPDFEYKESDVAAAKLWLGLNKK